VSRSIERFLDTPVKRYPSTEFTLGAVEVLRAGSSGMVVRLAFAVAAHLVYAQQIMYLGLRHGIIRLVAHAPVAQPWMKTGNPWRSVFIRGLFSG